MARELGVLGAAIVVSLYIVFAIRGFQFARRAKDNFGSLLCVGFTVWVIVQALLNIAVMTGAVPSTGVPLPLNQLRRFFAAGGDDRRRIDAERLSCGDAAEINCGTEKRYCES